MLNDPIYGMMSFEYDVLYRIIDHPYFQRLRRISQLALSHYVYPGAQHTRFQHAIGSLHLLTQTLHSLKGKGVYISIEEWKGVSIAILLHDIGHGPFSHALEGKILPLSHEKISYRVMNIIESDLNEDFSLAKLIYKNEYPRKFLNQLVSSQLDMDRMDYLTRDSFFSGVAEGIIGYDRIIKMLNVVDDTLVVEENGLFSIEKFLVARKLMYWQVYLHKAAIASEQMLVSTFQRIKDLIFEDDPFPFPENLKKILLGASSDPEDHLIHAYMSLDDVDFMYLMKQGINHRDKILQLLCTSVINRNLFKIILTTDKGPISDIPEAKKNILNYLKINESDIQYFYVHGRESFLEYNHQKDEIIFLMKGGELIPFSELNKDYSTKKTITKNTLCFWSPDSMKVESIQ